MWKTEMVTILRYLIDDTNFSDPTYPDARLEQMLLVAGQLVSTEVAFQATYSINVEKCTISPDPTSDPKDSGFINLSCLKAALVIVQNEYKTKSNSAIRIVDGPSSMDMTMVAQNLKGLYEKLLEDYENYKVNYATSNSQVGQAILSPYGSYWSRR
jgi:hypothetical protein